MSRFPDLPLLVAFRLALKSRRGGDRDEMPKRQADED